MEVDFCSPLINNADVDTISRQRIARHNAGGTSSDYQHVDLRLFHRCRHLGGLSKAGGCDLR